MTKMVKINTLFMSNMAQKPFVGNVYPTNKSQVYTLNWFTVAFS